MNILQVDSVSQHFDYKNALTLQDRLTGRTSKSDGFLALNDVSFELEQGKSLALLGPNGSGKSTLLKVIAGIYRPTSGTVRRRGRLSALLELGAGFHPELTGRENIFLNGAILGLDKHYIKKIIDDIIDFSGVRDFIDSPVKTYSSGMYVRLGFAVAVHVDPDLLLVDEVLAVGDEAFQNQCLEKVRELQNDGKSIVLVTHSMQSAAAFTDTAIVLNRGRLIFAGETGDAAQEYHKILAWPVDLLDGKPAHPVITDSKMPNVLANGYAVLKQNDSLNLLLQIERHGYQGDCALGFELWTSSGYLVHSNVLELDLAKSGYQEFVEFNLHIANPHLGPGSYRIALNLGKPGNNSHWSTHQAAALFAVDGDGALGTPHQMSIEIQ